MPEIHYKTFALLVIVTFHVPIIFAKKSLITRADLKRMLFLDNNILYFTEIDGVNKIRLWVTNCLIDLNTTYIHIL